MLNTRSFGLISPALTIHAKSRRERGREDAGSPTNLRMTNFDVGEAYFKLTVTIPWDKIEAERFRGLLFGNQKNSRKIQPDPPAVVLAAMRRGRDQRFFHAILAADNLQFRSQADQR